MSDKPGLVTHRIKETIVAKGHGIDTVVGKVRIPDETLTIGDEIGF